MFLTWAMNLTVHAAERRALEVDGDDGEPFTRTYEFTLDVSFDESGSAGAPVAGYGVGGGGGGNGTQPKGVARSGG